MATRIAAVNTTRIGALLCTASILAVGAAACWAADPSGSGAPVRDASELNAALASARAGRTIELAPGTYSGVECKNVDPGGQVTITSADPSHRAVITDLTVSRCGGLSFKGLEFNFPAAAPDMTPDVVGVRVLLSHDIGFEGDSIHGTLDGDPTNDIRGVHIERSSNVAVRNNEFQQLLVGVRNRADSNITISGNNFHDIRMDGIENEDTSHIVIQDNVFSSFFPVGEVATGGDHPD